MDSFCHGGAHKKIPMYVTAKRVSTILHFTASAILALGFFSILSGHFAPCGEIRSPRNLRAAFTESSIDLSWDSVPGVSGYNLYTCTHDDSATAHFRKVNKNLITSGMRYTYLWDVIDGKHVPGIKGIEHHIAVAAVCTTGGAISESRLSDRIDNRYFDGFSGRNSSAAIEEVLQHSQRLPAIPLKMAATSRRQFIGFMEGPGRVLDSLLRSSIDPQEVGGCSPIATITVQLLHDAGIEACKAEGVFVKEYHAFVVVTIDSAEYVLDFSANQFVPGVTPVLVPRDRCFLGADGRLGPTGTPVYVISRLYAWDQSSLADTKESKPYHDILEKVAVLMKGRHSTKSGSRQKSLSQPAKPE
jgi:hypothetical protein